MSHENIVKRLANKIDKAVLEKVQSINRKRTFSKNTTVAEALADEKKKQEQWSELRVFLDRRINSIYFHVFLGGLISLNLCLMVIEADAEARGDDAAAWVRYLGMAFACIYVTEVCCRVYVHRWDFFTSLSDLADAAIVLSDVFAYMLFLLGGSAALPSISFLRLFRIFRLVRAIKFLVLFPNLQMLIKGLLFSCRALFWGMLLMCVFLVMWGMLAVQLIHPLVQELTDAGKYDDCSRCPRAFSSVWQSIITLTQTLIAGDSWGVLAVPLVENFPVTFLFFMLALTCISLAVMNLILALVVDAALEARKQQDSALVQMKAEMREAATEHLLHLCRLLDKDGSGTLTLLEVRKGMEENQEFAHSMLAMDINEDDMDTVFSILDRDHSGDVDYAEFVKEMQAMRADDQHTMLVFIKHYTKSMHDELKTFLVGGQLDMIKTQEESLEKTVNHIEKLVAGQREVDLASVVREEVSRAMRDFCASQHMGPCLPKDDNRLPVPVETAAHETVEAPKDRQELVQHPALIAAASREAELAKDLEAGSGRLRKRMEALLSELEDALRCADMVADRPRFASRPLQTNAVNVQPKMRKERQLSQPRPADAVSEEPGGSTAAQICQTPSETPRECRSAWSQRFASGLGPEQEDAVRDYCASGRIV